MSENPVNLVLTDANAQHPANVLKGIRAILAVVRGVAVPLSEAESFWSRFMDGERPVVLAENVPRDFAQAAAEAGQAASASNLVLGIGLSAAELEAIAAAHKADDPAPGVAPERIKHADLFVGPADKPPADWTPSFSASKAALALLATNDGNPMRAIALARLLRHATADDVFEDAVRLMLATFPAYDG